MPHINGVFSDASAGRLLITLSGVYVEGVRRDSGFPSSFGGGSNLSIKPFAGPAGMPIYGQPIDRYAPTVTYELDYPGGNLLWSVGTVEIAHQNPSGGIWSYGWVDLRLNLKLIKR